MQLMMSMMAALGGNVSVAMCPVHGGNSKWGQGFHDSLNFQGIPCMVALKFNYSYSTQQSRYLCCYSVFNTEFSDFKALDADFASIRFANCLLKPLRLHDHFIRRGIALDYLKV